MLDVLAQVVTTAPSPADRSIDDPYYSGKTKMSCSPLRITDQTILRMRIFVPHGDEIGFYGPRNSFLWLGLSRRNAAENHRLPAGEAVYQRIARDGIRVKDFKGYASLTNGGHKMFSVKGWYRFEVSDGLGYPERPPDAWCRVYYTPPKGAVRSLPRDAIGDPTEY